MTASALPILRAVAELLSAGILRCIADGGIIAMIAWTLLRLTGERDAGTRFAVWFTALFAILLLPFTSLLRTPGPSAGYGASHSLITVSGSWAMVIFLGWATLTVAGLVRVARGFIKLRRLRMACRSIDAASLTPTLRQTFLEVKQTRPAPICISDQLTVPTAIGFLKPIVVLPAWALQELSPAELKQVLLHEFAHLSRWDDWTNLIQKILHAFMFFHPVVWWIENRLSLEREIACDDMVLAESGDPRTYAQSLLTVAEKSFARRSLSLAQAAVHRMRQTSHRVSQILDWKGRPAIGWKPAAAVFAVVALAGLSAIPKMPDIVTFRDTVFSPQPRAGSAEPARLQLATMAVQALDGKDLRASSLRPSSLRPTFKHPVFQNKRANTKMEATLVASRRPSDTAIEKAPMLTATAAESAVGREVQITQAIFVITRNRTPGLAGSADITIRVWQVRVYRTEATNQIPAKKV